MREKSDRAEMENKSLQMKTMKISRQCVNLIEFSFGGIFWIGSRKLIKISMRENFSHVLYLKINFVTLEKIDDQNMIEKKNHFQSTIKFSPFYIIIKTVTNSSKHHFGDGLG